MQAGIRKGITARSAVMAGTVMVVAYLVLIPLGMLLYWSFSSVPPGEPGAVFTFKNYLDAYRDPDFFSLLGNSLMYGAGNCLLTFVFGTTLAWLYERTNIPLKKAFRVLALVPFIIPGILSTISWIMLLSPKIGLINLSLMRLLHLQDAPLNIYTLPGMIWADGVHLYPLVFLMMSASFRSMDMSLEESATMAGAGVWKTLTHVTLPLMRPAALSAMLITFIRTIEAFEVPALIGLPAGVEVFTSKIYLAIHEYPANYGLAGSLSVMLLVLCSLGIVFYHAATARGERFATITGKAFRPRLIDLGKGRYVLAAALGLFFFVTVGLPIFILTWSSLVPFYQIPSLAALPKLSFANYLRAFDYPNTARAFGNSVFLMFSTATLTMLLAAVIAWIVVKSKMRGRMLLDALTFVPITFPGIVLGVSLLYVYLALPIPIYGTIWILLVAYMTKYLPYGVRTTNATIIQISGELEEAAALCGGSWWVTFRRITLPLLMPGFLAGWIYIAMISLRELSTSILLYSSGSQVLSIVIFDLWEAGQYPALCALGMIMIALLIFLAWAAERLGRKIGIGRQLAA